MGERRVAVITGAAGGIGSATALEFARRGYDVGVTDVADLAAAAAAVEAAGARCFALRGDLADLRFAQQLVDEVARALGRVDVLVNNAAWREVLTMREMTIESWDRTLRICLTAPAFLARWAAERMARGGVIINVSSIMAGKPWGMSPAYVAAKGGLDALTRDLAALYGRQGIRVVSISPGAVETEMTVAEKESDAEAKVRDWSRQMIPMGRWARAEEIARAIAMLAGDDASYITGAAIVIDGGWTHELYPHAVKRAIRPGEFP